MKAIPKTLWLFSLACVVSLHLVASLVAAESVRRPVWAGRFYEADPYALKAHIDRLTRKAQRTPIQIPENRSLRAIVMPHAGYVYSGWTAAHAARVLPRSHFSKVVLLGPDHRIGFQNAAISQVAAYETPLGRVKLHRDAAKLSRQSALFQTLPVERDREHSLEVILPFLQSYLGKFQLVPVIVGHGDTKRLADALDEIVDSDTLLVISSDLSHFLPYDDAVARDRETIDEIIKLKPKTLAGSENRACGRTPLLVLTEIARRRNWKPMLIHYSNSGDTAGDRSRVVGYAAIAFFGDQSMENNENSTSQFDEEQGRMLVKLARQTISQKLGVDTIEPADNDSVSAMGDDCFKLHCGTFVTLKIKGQLRGCIGNLTSNETVVDGVKRNAINAAFHDPRFSPLSKDELNRTQIEVSILTEPRPLAYQDGQDLIRKLRANVDGVIIRKGHASATFLPQVWEQLPKPEDFLTHLCMKAGLPSDAWQNSDLEVSTYQVQYFEEGH
jgi:AmmeMemoRadiSam system protein B/AmmeMemoRadiSam system protein A